MELSNNLRIFAAELIMYRRMNAEKMMKLIAEYFKTQPVLKAWIFGSYSRGEQRLDSDVDILILPDSYIFAMPLGTCVEPSTMRDALNYLLAIAEIEHANFHSLRHTFATRAIEAGMPVKTLSDILRHSQVQITIPILNSNTKNHSSTYRQNWQLL